MGNQCSGGISKRKKKSIRLQIQELAEWDHHAVPVTRSLPTKLWRVVLIHAEEEDGNQNVLDITVKHNKRVNVRTKLPGTDLSSSSQLHLFSANGICISDKDNLCTLRTVSSPPNSNTDPSASQSPPYNILYKKFSKLVNSFGEQMCVAEYSVRDDVPESIEGLRNIFDMKNLRFLNIFCKDWSHEYIHNGLLQLKNELDMKILLGRQGENGCLASLESLQILGNNGFLPLNYLFFPNYSIKSLSLCFKNDSSPQSHCPQHLTSSIPVLTPNVKILKVYDVNEKILCKIMPPWGSLAENEGKLRHLEHLTVKLQFPFKRTLNVLCKAIDVHCADSIKSLHLRVSQKPPQNSMKVEDDSDIGINIGDINPLVKLEKLEELDICFDLHFQQQDFITKFTPKTPNIKSISFTSFDAHSGEFPDFEGFCKLTRYKLPRTLEKVSVNYWISGDVVNKEVWNYNEANPVLRKETVTVVRPWLQIQFIGDGNGEGDDGISTKIKCRFHLTKEGFETVQDKAKSFNENATLHSFCSGQKTSQCKFFDK